MSSSEQTNLAMARGQANKLTDDFIFGFDVKDADDSQYLAEIAINRMGQKTDIQNFVNLSLMHGVQEWNQAISCATSMRDRATFNNPLDGQDTLSFLAKIYGVDATSHTADELPTAQKADGPCVKKRRRTPLEFPPENACRKRWKINKGKYSPYWAATPASALRKNGNPGDGPTASQREPISSKKCVPPPETPGSQIPDVGRETPRDSTMPVQGYGEHEFGLPNILNNGSEPMEIKSPLRDNQGYGSEPTCDRTTKAPTGDPNSDSWQDSDSDANSKSESVPPEPDTPTETSEVPATFIAATENAADEEDSVRTAEEAPDDENSRPPSPLKQIQTLKRKAKSPYFAEHTTPKPKSTPNRRPPRGTVSSLSFPPLDVPNFGLIQEELATDPFRLLIAVTFLIRTSGKAAIPVFRELMECYPSPEALAMADTGDIVAMISHLGLGVVRAATIQRYARIWLENPPKRGVKYAVKNYPLPGTEDGDENIGSGGVYVSLEELWDETREEWKDTVHPSGETLISTSTSTSTSKTMTTEWEIGHMTQGPYALDSWRIFCRDVLRGVSQDWKGTTISSSKGEGEGEVFQPEWMRVLPRDKELRACLRWMWMQEGWLWDPFTGDKVVLPEGLRRAVQERRVGYDDSGDLRILDAESRTGS